MKIVYILYEYCIALPIMLVLTIITAIISIIFASIFGDEFWGWWPARIWGRLFCRIFLLPVHVEGNEHLDPKQAYIFVPNHQSMFDIFLMLGFLGHKFKWVMKKELAKIPLVGFACKCCGFIYINRTGKNSIAESMTQADATLKNHKSLAIFAEGTRTRTGKLGIFKRGAFKLAIEENLPIVPISINGCYETLPKGRYIVKRHPLKLIVHKPIAPEPNNPNAIEILRNATRQTILSGLEEQYI